MGDNFKNPIASTDDGVASLASIITQVDRDGNPSTIEKRPVQSTQRSKEITTNNNYSRFKSSYILDLFFSCCSARSDVIDNQSSTSLNNIELSVAATQNTVIQSQKYSNNNSSADANQNNKALQV